jgi:hypothetical protein
MAVLDRQNIRVGVQRNAREAHSLTNTIKGTLGLKGPGIRHAGLRPPPEPNIGLKSGYRSGARGRGAAGKGSSPSRRPKALQGRAVFSA